MPSTICSAGPWPCDNTPRVLPPEGPGDPVTTRRAFSGCAAAVIVAVLVACAFGNASGQARESTPRVGMLTPAPSEAAKPSWDAFREAMKELGYVEGKSVVYE